MRHPTRVLQSGRLALLAAVGAIVTTAIEHPKLLTSAAGLSSLGLLGVTTLWQAYAESVQRRAAAADAADPTAEDELTAVPPAAVLPDPAAPHAPADAAGGA